LDETLENWSKSSGLDLDEVMATGSPLFPSLGARTSHQSTLQTYEEGFAVNQCSYTLNAQNEMSELDQGLICNVLNLEVHLNPGLELKTRQAVLPTVAVDIKTSNAFIKS
jgi:hypothetical protein